MFTRILAIARDAPFRDQAPPSSTMPVRESNPRIQLDAGVAGGVVLISGGARPCITSMGSTAPPDVCSMWQQRRVICSKRSSFSDLAASSAGIVLVAAGHRRRVDAHTHARTRKLERRPFTRLALVRAALG